ncbi:hypothetical protein CEXT_761461 [Caerostris extrusa]|uniref:Transposase n=1 Tax=Caerostris extrusa TaxID=172846 RepID=A0AAV4QFI7_CAEEX|nr:hypothetical protein CEXT_761461 [Caerostris extrusa]
MTTAQEKVRDMIMDQIDTIDFLGNMIFSDELTFHIFGTVNHHNVRSLGSEQPNVVLESVIGSDKSEFGYCLMPGRISDHFLCKEP